MDDYHIKYYAAYDAACSLELLVEDLDAGLKPSALLIDEAKRKLLRLAEFEAGEPFFGRFRK